MLLLCKAGSVYLRWTPHPVIVAIRDNKDYIRVLLYSYYTTITGWGVLLTSTPFRTLLGGSAQSLVQKVFSQQGGLGKPPYKALHLSFSQISFRWPPPHPVIAIIRHLKDYIRVLLYSFYTTSAGWWVLLRYSTFLGWDGSQTSRHLTVP